jgi:hypothetical protein
VRQLAVYRIFIVLLVKSLGRFERWMSLLGWTVAMVTTLALPAVGAVLYAQFEIAVPRHGGGHDPQLLGFFPWVWWVVSNGPERPEPPTLNLHKVPLASVTIYEGICLVLPIESCEGTKFPKRPLCGPWSVAVFWRPWRL